MRSIENRGLLLVQCNATGQKLCAAQVQHGGRRCCCCHIVVAVRVDEVRLARVWAHLVAATARPPVHSADILSISIRTFGMCGWDEEHAAAE